MLQFARRLHLLQEALAHFRVFDRGRTHHLDGNQFVQEGVPRLVHRSHAALPEFAQDLVLGRSEQFRRHVVHGVGRSAHRAERCSTARAEAWGAGTLLAGRISRSWPMKESGGRFSTICRHSGQPATCAWIAYSSAAGSLPRPYAARCSGVGCVVFTSGMARLLGVPSTTCVHRGRLRRLRHAALQEKSAQDQVILSKNEKKRESSARTSGIELRKARVETGVHRLLNLLFGRSFASRSRCSTHWRVWGDSVFPVRNRAGCGSVQIAAPSDRLPQGPVSHDPFFFAGARGSFPAGTAFRHWATTSRRSFDS